MSARMKLHPTLTTDRIVEAVERQMLTLDDPGFCLECGHEQGGCEPDARKIKCEACGAMAVFGAEELFNLSGAGTP